MTKMIPTTINGKWDLMLPEHRALRPEWDIKNGGWEVERLDAMHKDIKPGMIVYDVGTEEGDMSALLGKWVGEKGIVILFEPNPKVWPNIKAIWEANDIKATRGCFEGFAAETSGDSGILIVDGYWPNCAEGEIIGDHGFMNLSERDDISRVSLDDVAFKYYADRPIPDVITIDVEGAELRVLHGARGILTAHSPVVFVSVHDAFMAQMYDEYAADLFKYMKDLGYKYELLAYDHELHVRFYK